MKRTRIKTIISILFLLLKGAMVEAQENKHSMISPLTFNEEDQLVIDPSSASSSKDYNFLLGKWTVKNRKLKSRLTGNKDWEEFDSILELQQILLGIGNRETFTATIKGKPYEAIAIRLFDPNTKLWTDYWADSNNGTFDEHPVVGSFEGNVGSFYAIDEFKGKPIVVVYQWDYTKPDHPQWRQAYSADRGKTWEWNWYMDLTKIK